MRRRMISVMGLFTGIASILCWLVMFAAGTDVWHAIGRPDLWSSQKPPYPDVRAFLWAYYLLFPALLAHMAFVLATFVSGRRQERHCLTE